MNPFIFEYFQKITLQSFVTNVDFRSLDLFLGFNFIIIMSHVRKLRHREEVLGNCRKFISKERHIEFR